jgi:hypothetical protein
MTHLADLRKSYERAELSEEASDPDPLKQFALWLAEAISAQLPEPNAMTLATVDQALRPSTRVVLIKGYDENGITWFTNYDSRKGRELAANPWAALQFHWVELERVVRIEGQVDKGERRGKRRLLRQLVRSIHASAPGPARRARSLPAAASWSPTRRAMAPASCSTRRGPHTGAATACGRTAGSSGRDGRAACTTACATGRRAISNGYESVWRRAAPTASPNPGGLRNKRPPLAHRAAIRGRSSHNGGHSSRLVARGRRRHRRPPCRKRHSHPIVAVSQTDVRVDQGQQKQNREGRLHGIFSRLMTARGMTNSRARLPASLMPRHPGRPRLFKSRGQSSINAAPAATPTTPVIQDAFRQRKQRSRCRRPGAIRIPSAAMSSGTGVTVVSRQPLSRFRRRWLSSPTQRHLISRSWRRKP